MAHWCYAGLLGDYHRITPRQNSLWDYANVTQHPIKETVDIFLRSLRIGWIA